MKKKIQLLPTKRLMDLYQLILNYSKERGEHNRSLFLLLLEKVATELNLRGYRITVDKQRIATFVLRDDAIKNPDNYVKEPNHWKEAAYLMHKTMATQRRISDMIERERWKAIWSEAPTILFNNQKDAMLYSSRTGNTNFIVLNSSYNVNPNMKNILIRIDNPTLLNYVYTEVRKGITTKEQKVTIRLIDNLRFYAIRLADGRMESLAAANRIPALEGEKEFTVTAARNADTIIEQVIKEYNKPNITNFILGGDINNKAFTVAVYPEVVQYLGEVITHKQAIDFFSKGIATERGLSIGGYDYTLFTANDGQKYYASKTQINELINGITIAHCNG